MFVKSFTRLRGLLNKTKILTVLTCIKNEFKFIFRFKTNKAINMNKSNLLIKKTSSEDEQFSGAVNFFAGYDFQIEHVKTTISFF